MKKENKRKFNLQFLSQAKLVSLKPKLQKELNRKEEELIFAKGKQDKEAVKEILKDISLLQKDLFKVKVWTSLYNLLSFTFIKVYKREIIANKLRYLILLTKGKGKDHDKFIDSIKIQGKHIKHMIHLLGKRKNKMDKVLNRINNFIKMPIFPKSFEIEALLIK